MQTTLGSCLGSSAIFRNSRHYTVRWISGLALLFLGLLLAGSDVDAEEETLAIDNYQVVNSVRVGRLEVEFTIKADITNLGPAIDGVTARLVSNAAATSPSQAFLNFGPVASDTTVTSSDTFTVIQDRTSNFDPTSMAWTFSSQPSAPTITPPPSPTKLTTIPVSGTARPNAALEIVGGASVVTATASAAGVYTANVPLQPNRLNKLFVTAITGASERGAPATANVVQDTQAPSLFIDFPVDGAEVTNETIAVTGRVGDMLGGYAGLDVTVNGQPANVDVGIGNNGTFERAGVPLVIGSNPIIVVASDVNGNSVTRQITVKRIALSGPRMVVSTGDMQQGTIRTLLGAPIVVQVLNEDGTPFAGKLVTFNVTRSDGRLKPTMFGAVPGKMMFQTHTDATGYAAAYWTLGGDSGRGNNRVTVTSRDVSGTVVFCASAAHGPLSQINIGSGNNQRVETNSPAPEALRAWVSDSCNGIGDVPVTFTVLQGGGKVNGRSSITVPSTRTGHAEVTFIAGPDTGNQLIEANYPGNTGSPATFVVFGVQRDPNVPTSFSGLVLDNTSQPIGGAFCSLTVGGVTLTATSDAQGRFVFTNIPAGRADFFVSGATATSLGGSFIPPNSFPFLTFFVPLIPNAGNTLPSPVLLPRLNPANNVTYNGTTDLVLTCQGMEGLKMTIKSNSMRKGDGSLVTPQNTSVVSLNQVHHDNVPMPIPDGAAPPFTWTLQPARATFDPPIQIEYPNMSGLSPGAVANFLSYNHDTERFEIISSGHVTTDGSTIVADPGSGLSLAGWGCNCPPYSVTAECKKCKETCVDSGTLTSNGSVSVNKTKPNAGETILFTYSGTASDSGGGKQIECDDGSSRSEAISPATPTYTYELTTPSGTTKGTGRTASATASECGTYTCKFAASVDRECAPSPLSLGSASAEVNVSLTEIEITPQRINFSALTDLLRQGGEIVGNTGICRFTPPGEDLTAAISVSVFQGCCEGTIKDGMTKLKGQFGAGLGSVQCDVPVIGVPYTASLNFTFGASASFAFSVDGRQTCDKDSEVCGTLNLSGSANGGVSATVAGGVIRLALVLEVGGISGTGEWCSKSAGKAKLCFGSVAVVGTATLATFIDKEVRYTITEGICTSEVTF